MISSTTQEICYTMLVDFFFYNCLVILHLYFRLDCNDECKLLERNRKLAIGLQIRNPELSSKLQPKYSDFIKGWARKDPPLVTMIHEKLTELVKLAKQSQQRSRSHSFPTMNREKRQVTSMAFSILKSKQ